MKTSQKLTLRVSEIRQRLNEIGGLADDALTDEIRSERDGLVTEYGETEAKLRAAIIAEDDEAKRAETRGGGAGEDAETAELRSLQGRISLGRFLQCFADGEQLSGAERELTEHRGLTVSGHVVPWDAFLPPPGPPAELRADVVTPAPASGNPTNPTEIIGRVFARTAARRLGVMMPSVPIGQASYPVLTTGQTAEFVDPDAAKEAAAGSFTPNVLTGVRLQARVQFRIEDMMTTPGLETAHRADLTMSLGDQLDKQIVSPGNARVRGFLATRAQGGIPDYANPGDVITFAAAAEQAARGVDGIYAGGEDELSWVIGVASYAKLAGLIQDNDSTSATERLRRILRDFMASAHIPAAAANIQSGILAKLGAADGGMNAVAPIWEGVKLIRDEVTNAASGLIQVTAVALHNFKVLRPAAFVRTKFKLVA